MPSALAQVLSGEGTCQNICDLQEKEDKAWDGALVRCVDKLDRGNMFWIVVLAVFPVCFAILMAVFCDCKKLCWPCCDENHRNEQSGRMRRTLLRSSIIVVFFVAISAFMITFFALQNESNPCATALGQCTTISCVCGNRYFQGYVFMFVSLTLCAVLLIQDLHREIHRVITEKLIGENLVPQAACMERIVAVGLLMVVFTGVFPTMEVKDGVDTGKRTKNVAKIFHIFGIVCGCLILTLYANSVVWFHFCSLFSWYPRSMLSWCGEMCGCKEKVESCVGTNVHDSVKQVPFFKQKIAYFWVWVFYVVFFGYANDKLPKKFHLSPVEAFDHCPKMGSLEYWGSWDSQENAKRAWKEVPSSGHEEEDRDGRPDRGKDGRARADRREDVERPPI